MSLSQHGNTTNSPELSGSYFKMFDVPGTRFKPAALLELVTAIDNREILIDDRSKIPSGLTYLGQFIDHDVTHMKRLTQVPGDQAVPVSDLIQLRSPSLDLDSLYGDGLSDLVIPYDNSGKFVSEYIENGLIYDLPRNHEGKKFAARIVESRNDENFIVAQLHVLFMNLHNKIIDSYTEGSLQDRFDKTRRELTLLYQLVTVNDFLKTFLDETVYQHLFANGGSSASTNTKETLLNSICGEEARIPVEFAGAAFRFGHSLVRGSYRLNEQKRGKTLKTLFMLTGKGGLNGLQNVKDFKIDWKFFFNINSSPFFEAFSIKTKISDKLRNLVNEAPGNQDLLLRNLLRGKELDLPCAQDAVQYVKNSNPGYANAISLECLSEEELLSHDLGNALAKNDLQAKTPLWIYILMEPFFNNSSNSRLGKLGSVIVGETFRTLLDTSYTSIYEKGLNLGELHVLQNTGSTNDYTQFKMADLISYLQN